MSWREGLSEELRDNETLKRYDTLDDVSKALLEGKAAGSQSIRIPPEDSGPEVRKAFLDKLVTQAPEVMLKPADADKDELFRTLGMPEDITGYNNPPDTASVGDEIEEQIRAMSLGARLTNEQYQSVIKDMSAMNTAAVTNQGAIIEADQKALKDEWGMTYDERVEKAKKVNEDLYPEVDFANLSGLEIKGRYETSTRLHGKGPQGPAQPNNEPVVITPAEAMRRRSEIMQRPEYWNQSSPEQAHLIQQVVELGKQAGMTEEGSDFKSHSFTSSPLT